MAQKQSGGISKTLAIALSAAIVSFSPGLGCYKALAAQSLVPAEAITHFNGIVLNGVDMGDLLSQVSQEPALTPEVQEAVQWALADNGSVALADLAARMREEASHLPAQIEAAKQDGDTAPIEQTLSRLKPYHALLQKFQQEAVAKTQQRLTQYKEKQALGLLDEARQAWEEQKPEAVSVELNLGQSADKIELKPLDVNTRLAAFSPKLSIFSLEAHSKAPAGRILFSVKAGADKKIVIPAALRALGAQGKAPGYPRDPKSAGYDAYVDLPDAAQALAAALALAGWESIAAMAIHPQAAEIFSQTQAGAQAAVPELSPGLSQPANEHSAGVDFSAYLQQSSSDIDLKGLREFLHKLLDQGMDIQHGGRSYGVRYAAAELLGEIAGPEDLEWARGFLSDPRKLRNDFGARGTGFDHYYVEIAAAALIIGKQGRRTSADEKLLEKAFDAARSAPAGDNYSPFKLLVIDAHLAWIKPENAAQVRELKDRYEEERKKWDGHTKEVLYLALSQYGGPEVKDWLKEDLDSDQPRARALARYLQRVDPGDSADLYEKWKKGVEPDKSKEKFLQLYALAQQTPESEAHHNIEKLMALFRPATMVDSQFADSDRITPDVTGQALGSLVSHFKLYGCVKSEIRGWLRAGFETTFPQLMAAVIVAGAASKEEEDEQLLQSLFEMDPEVVAHISYKHEVSQQEAAVSWARIAVRSGRIEQYLAKNERDEQGRPISRIEKMLTDVNPMVNKAALEALKLYVQVRKKMQQRQRTQLPSPEGRRAG